MTRTRRVVGLALLVVVTAAIVPMAGAAAQENDATAVNTKDGKSVFKLAFKVKQVNNDSDVQAENSATAFASCEDCRTVAGAIQVVLVSGEPDAITAENSALAINYQCTECETLAAAYQFVIAGGEELEFSDEGKARLRELRKEFKDLKQRDDLSTQELAVEIARIAGEVAKVVDTELVTADQEEDATDGTTTTAPDSSSTTASTSQPDDTISSTPSTTASDSAPSTTTTP